MASTRDSEEFPLELRLAPVSADASDLSVESMRAEMGGKVDAPLPSDTSLWRYMSLGKFVALLGDSALWFSRIDLFDDPFEGSTPLANIAARAKDCSPHPDPSAQGRLYKAMAGWMLANCWHIGPNESEAMWQLYAPHGEGVAIRSNQERLLTSLRASVLTQGRSPITVVRLAPVQYVEYRKVYLTDPHQISRYFLKRSAFQHEREYRAIAPLPDILRGVSEDASPGVSGMAIPIDLATLLEAVVIAPHAPPWFRRSVEYLGARFGLTVPIMVSGLEEQPMF